MNEPPPIFFRIPLRDRIALLKRLSMMTRSGIPLADAVSLCARGRHSRSSLFVLSAIRADISRGVALSQSLARFPRFFDTFAVRMVAIGEETGTLSQSLGYVADELKKRQALKAKLIGTMIYPIVILVATLALSISLTVFIFPKIAPLFRSFHHELPLSTRILIMFSDFLLRDGWWCAIALACCALVAARALRYERVRRSADRMLVAIPLAGLIVRSYELATFASTMHVLLRSNVRFVAALQIASASASNARYRDTIALAGIEAARGARLSTLLARTPALFPDIATQMIQVGEECGDLAGSFRYLSDMYAGELDDLSRNLSSMIEPVLMIVMGSIVGFVALSIIAPIYGITDTLSTH